ncbi:C45 family autoproteolytic acyltransferase/hydolase [Cohnella thailandensis]|uniref:Peptidase C45 hydrolase domain-containing protein n=1 Tax=Cohnella thailandensis TaxID=557557 RepID=A0A841T1T4_9BACL|nr:C45 family peptidase [Cohnella thailandensis]MBB6635041.1 hypothetical protein [Cohnella thailandensis]MBP1975735.1 putative choloylglycine hydrolase [Cohnella thailandensis]
MEWIKPYLFKRLPSLRENAAAWASHIERHWDLEFYRPQSPMSAEEVRQRIDRFMPELRPEFEALLAASPDLPGQAQLIAMVNLRPFFSGCSNSISLRLGHPTLIRNYDLGIDGFAGVFRYEPLPGDGWIIGSAEGGWGYLDGLNHHGLALSITFGGNYATGDGFAIPLIVRYLLKTCSSVPEAAERLRRLPHRLHQNISLLDREGRYSVVYASPTGATEAQGLLCCTNHQPHPAPAANHSTERFEFLSRLSGEVSPERFLEPPLYNRRYSDHFGTLYTVEFDPVAGTARYLWPHEKVLLATKNSPETEIRVTLSSE